jgi:Zn-dependent M28 family amino/carboxypeptidase
MRLRLILAAIPVAAAAACASLERAPSPPAFSPGDLSAALASVDAPWMLDHIRVLSSDDFEGRAPGTRGEALTLEYLVREFRALDLEPGSADGTYLQKVPLVEYRSHPALTVERGGQSVELQVPRDFVAWSPRRSPEVLVTGSEIVFVGYGVLAAEYGWDDFKGADLRGKTLLMLVNDPQIPDPAEPKRLDDAMFKGRAMTYYGRWTYKYEMAARLGAAAALVMHETIPAAYPYSVVVNSQGRENFELAGESRGYPTVAGWIPVEQSRAMLAAAGLDLEDMKRRALSRDFRPVPLGARATFRIRNTWRDVPSHNVLARIEGSDPELRREAVVFTAHWDHFGWDQALPGPKANQVFHGARDNAGGIASMLSLARAFKTLPRAPRRTLLFVATTAEERSLLGATHYVNHPVVPLERTLAAINMDGINVWGRTADVVVAGHGQSTLDEMIAEAAATQSRKAVPDPRPETGGFFRSDHLPFVRAGVPAAYFGGGREYIGRPPGFAEEKRLEYVNNRYHKVADVIEPGWDLSGAVLDTQLRFLVGLRVAEGAAYPQWREGSEFKARRDEMMRGR